MEAHVMITQDLIRKAVIEVAQLPENELLVVMELVGELKKQRARPDREAAAQVVAHARNRMSAFQPLVHVIQRALAFQLRQFAHIEEPPHP